MWCHQASDISLFTFVGSCMNLSSMKQYEGWNRIKHVFRASTSQGSQRSWLPIHVVVSPHWKQPAKYCNFTSRHSMANFLCGFKNQITFPFSRQDCSLMHSVKDNFNIFSTLTSFKCCEEFPNSHHNDWELILKMTYLCFPLLSALDCINHI